MNGSTQYADDLLASLEEEVRTVEAAWIDAEFAAIIAAGWDATPPPPPKTPSGIPARWPDHGPAPTAPRRRWPHPHRAASEGRATQRSPPAVV
jgi:hypothetical protein